ncbi:MAG: radical SAM protein [Ruminococcus flavefaciens]|nr:radical SAM protein [Roseburia sp.]MCM1234456.1 radical SAM protein [Ruminococcus flavefaciens]
MKLVQLFKTPNAYYAFDAIKSKLIEIQRELYEYFKDEKSGGEEASRELLEFQERGFFCGKSPVKQISHPYADVLDVYMERKVSKVTLQVTQQCNFRCSYCVYSEEHNLQQRSHSNRKMDFAIAKQAVDYLREHSIDSPDVNIGFYGGEPLLNFDLVRQVITYSKEIFYGKTLTYSLTTNGSLLDDDIVDFLQENHVSLMISLDGPKSIHDCNRRFGNGEGTYDVVMSKIQRIRERYPDYWESIQYSMVMDPANDFAKISSICQSEEIIPQKLFASIIDKDYDNTVVEVSEKYAENYEYSKFLAFLAYWDRYPEEKVSAISIKQIKNTFGQMYHIDMMGELREADIPAGPCIPGAMRMFVDVDGKIFPCERVSEQSDAMNIGNIESGFQLDKVRQLLEIGKLTEDNCKDCWCFRMCNQCAKKADTGNGKLMPQARLRYCKNSMSAAYAKLREYILAREVSVYYKEQIRKIM